MPAGKRRYDFELTTLTASKGEMADRELFAAKKEIEDLKHQLDVAEKQAKAAAALLLRKPR